MDKLIDNEIVNEAVDFIMENLPNNIGLDEVADHCNLSKYHFSRVFKSQTGETVYSFIKRLKMERSALRIKLEKDKPITDIGLDYGYSSSNYSSAFKEHHRISPSEFRLISDRDYILNPFKSNETYRFKDFEYYNRKIDIVEIEDFSVIYERSIGTYIDLGKTWCDFLNKYQSYYKEGTILIERSYDDPTVTELNQCIYDVCMIVDNPLDFENTMVIKGGKYGVFHFKGHASNIFLTFQGIFNIWLPGSGYTIDNRYGFDIYTSVDGANMLFEMDLYIPIK